MAPLESSTCVHLYATATPFQPTGRSGPVGAKRIAELTHSLVMLSLCKEGR